MVPEVVTDVEDLDERRRRLLQIDPDPGDVGRGIIESLVVVLRGALVGLVLLVARLIDEDRVGHALDESFLEK